MTKKTAGEGKFDEEAFWTYVEEEFIQIEATFNPAYYPLETKEQALAGELRGYDKHSKHKSLVRSRWVNIIRYRDIGPDLDSRDYYYSVGSKLVPLLRDHIERRKITFEFLRDFAEAKTCYGFIISYILDDSDTLGTARATKRSAESRAEVADKKKVFVAHLLNEHHIKGATAKEAVRKVAQEIAHHIECGLFDADYPKQWFEGFLNRTDGAVTLASTYCANNLTKTDVERLAQQPLSGLPKINVPSERAEK